MVSLTCCRYYSSSDKRLIKFCLTTAWILNALSVEESIQAIWVFQHKFPSYVLSPPSEAGLSCVSMLQPKFLSGGRAACETHSPPTPFWCRFLRLLKTPEHTLFTWQLARCAGVKKRVVQHRFVFCFFVLFFFFRFSRFLFIFPATPRMPSLSITAGFSPHLRLQWLRETLNTCLHGWTVSFHFFSFKHVFLSILTSLKIYIWYWYHIPFST